MDLSDAEQAALNYAAPRGIPLSVFLGRVVYPGDQQWTERDTAAAMWWQADQDRRCKTCGLYLDETMDPANEFKYEAEAVWCHGDRAMHRAALELAGRSYADADPMAGTRFRFVHTPSMEAS